MPVDALPLTRTVKPKLVRQVYTCIELFCGTAWVSKRLKLAGHSVASFDIILGDPLPGKQNAMDLLSDAGFAPLGSIVRFCALGCAFLSNLPWFGTMYLRLALVTVLKSKPDECLCVIGLDCSSFVTINAGTHCRTPITPLGDESVAHVRRGNRLASRKLGCMATTIGLLANGDLFPRFPRIM